MDRTNNALEVLLFGDLPVTIPWVSRYLQGIMAGWVGLAISAKNDHL